MKIAIASMSPLLGLISCQNFASLISTIPFLTFFWGSILMHIPDIMF